MRILLVTPGMQSPWIDGRITSLRVLAEALVARGVAVQVLTTDGQEEGKRSYYENGVAYEVLPGGSWSNWLRLLMRFWQMVSRARTDQVIYRPFAGFNVTNIVSVFSLRLLSFLRRMPFNLSLWGGPKQLLRVPWLFSAVIVSNKVAVTSPKVLPIPPLVDMKPVRAPNWSVNPLRQYGFVASDRVCLFTYCGQVNSDSLWKYTLEQRGLGDLIEAAVHLQDMHDLKFLVSIPVLGTPDGRERLTDLLRARNVEDRFVMTSSIDNLAEVLSAVQAYIYPVNIDEPSWAPISMLEALACDTTVVTTCTPIIQEFMSSEEVLMYEPGNSDQLSQLIRLATQDRKMVDALTARGREKVIACNSSVGVADHILSVLQVSVPSGESLKCQGYKS